MPDHPLIFSAPMVRALIEERKTQTRLVLKRPLPPDDADVVSAWFPPVGAIGNWAPGGLWAVQHIDDDRGRGGYNRFCGKLPYAPSDRLWVREAWNIAFVAELAPGEQIERTAEECAAANGGFACACGDGIAYSATGLQQHPQYGKAVWRSPIHMPRWASRLTLHVTAVRVERLQAVSEADAVAEGVEPLLGSKGPNYFTRKVAYGAHTGSMNAPTAREVYADLWNSLHGPGSWDANPWVAAITFTVHRGNID